MFTLRISANYMEVAEATRFNAVRGGGDFWGVRGRDNFVQTVRSSEEAKSLLLASATAASQE